MDGMAFLIAVVTFIMALIAFHKISGLETRIAQLKMQLGGALDELAKLKASGPVAAPAEREVLGLDERGAPVYADSDPDTLALVAEKQAAASASASAEASSSATASSSAESSVTNGADASAMASAAASVAAPAPARKQDMEQALASRWFVWIGGLAIAIGGLLFVKYAYDNGLISPTLQIILGLLAGFVLVGAGELVRRKTMSATEARTSYVPAALSAAGLAILFASIYAAYALYQLIDPMVAFAGLAAVGLGAFGLSRWQGPLIAGLGLIGSFGTPALIPSQDPSALGFFPYLAIILAASFLTLRGRNWWWLAFAALGLSTLWSLLWIIGPYEPADIWPVGLFALFMALAGTFGLKGLAILRAETGELARPASLTAPLLIAVAGLAAGFLVLTVLTLATKHAGPALVMLAAAAVFTVLLGFAKQGLAPLAPAAALVMLAVLMGWPEAALHAWVMDEVTGQWSWSNSFAPESSRFLEWMLLMGAVFTLAGIAGVMARQRPTAFGLLGGGAGLLYIGGAWARADFLLGQTSWAALAACYAVVMLFATAFAGRRSEEAEAGPGAGLLAAGAAGLIVFALDRVFDGVALTLAISAEALAFAALAMLLRPRLLGPITAGLASLAAIRLFVSRELWTDEKGLMWGEHWVLYGYGIPAILFYAGSRLLRRGAHERSAVALEGISLGLLISLASLEIRVLIGGGVTYEDPRFLEMAAHVLTWLGAAYGLMHRQRLFSGLISLWGARALIAAGTGGILLFSMLALNPVFTEEPVPGSIVFNALLLAYLAPVILIGLIAARLGAIGWEKLKPAAGVLALVLAFTYVTLQTKLIFQGKIMQPESLTIAESYAYSGVWLAFALGLFVAGIRLGRKVVRMAGLTVMALVVLKVFAWDMSNLEGLYRIASFIGLGLCLVGIGWLYQRFVQMAEPAKPAS